MEYDWRDGHIVDAKLIGEVNNELSAVQTRLMLLMTDEWQLTAELYQKLGDSKPSTEQVRRALLDLADHGQIKREPPMGQDVKGKSVKWAWTPLEIGVKESERT